MRPSVLSISGVLLLMSACAVSDHSMLTLLGPAPDQKRPARCTYHRVHRRAGADCSRKEFLHIPKTLKTDTEVLDVSYNRIRELLNDTFSAYTNIRYLYLGDNMIQTIEAGAFDPIPNLEALDLSINSIITVPMQIFQLPYLKFLYLHHNKFLNLRNDLRELRRPIAAPLQRLDMSYCHLTMLPDLGILPDLAEFNVSGNPFISLLPVDLAPYCSLMALDLHDINFAQAIGFCNCRLLEAWVTIHVPTVLRDKDELCVSTDSDFIYCSEDPKVNETNAMYESCKSMILHRKLEYNAKMTWIIVASCVSAILLIAACVLYRLHKKNIKRTHSTSKVVQENNTNVETLLKI